MNRLSKKYLRIAVLLITFSFALSIVASPAYSRGRRHHSPRHHHGPHHVRIFPDSDVLPALLVGGIIAGITFSLIESASPPVSEYRVGTRTYAHAPIVSPPHDDGIFDGSVMVTAQLLNVRTGPSLDAPIMRQLPYGTVLSVCDSSPGWYYVNLPGNRRGWVMAQFTEPFGKSGDG